MSIELGAARAAAVMMSRIADRPEAQFQLPSAYQIKYGLMQNGNKANILPSGCCQPGFDSIGPEKPWVVTPSGRGKATIDLGNYELLLNEESSQIQIVNKQNGEVTNIWGDPHIDWNKDGKTDADFWSKTTFQLEDGTKITIDTEPWKGNDNMYVASEITITQGERAIQVTGISQNELGDLKIEQSDFGGGLADWAVTDGFVVQENPNGEGWINPETGKLATQEDFNITKPDVFKPYEFTQERNKALGTFLHTGVMPDPKVTIPPGEVTIMPLPGNSEPIFGGGPGPVKPPCHIGEATVSRETDFLGRPTKTVIDAGAGNDRINIHTNRDGSVVVTVNNEKYHFSAAEARNLEVRGGNGNDTITSSGEQSAVSKAWCGETKITIDGGSGNDIISGGTGAETIRGGAGNDHIDGGDGNDSIRGGRGNDYINGGRGNDYLDGGQGNDTIVGGDGNDHIHGGQGNDYIFGGNGNDAISGGRGNDYINGGSGNDRLQGNRGIDTIVGGAGNDIISGGRGNDVIIGGTGNDTIRGGRGNDYVNGGSGNDHIHGNNGNDVIIGGAGNDDISGGRGNDYINGGSGNDHIHGDRGNDVIIGGAGNDDISGGRGNDHIFGGDGHDDINGGPGNDHLRGGRGNDHIRG
jgi:Ca2+-binding RTX toxin-like protein